MQKILNKYCEYKNGLFIFPLPTGIGKTYHVLEYILKKYKENRKIFFITNLKKNLPVQELKNKFRQCGKKTDFGKHFIALDSNADTIIGTLLKTNCPKFITDMPEYKALHNCVSLVQGFDEQKTKDAFTKQLIEKAKDDIRKTHEPKFRRGITDWLDDELKKANKKDLTESIKIIYIQKNHPWLVELYPAILSSKKRIFFLSVDKFFLKNTTLVRPSYYFWEDKITEDAIIFIDEFDATKSHVLNQIIENGYSKKVDLLGLFTHLYSSLSTLQVPQDIVQESNERIALRDKNISVPKIADIFDSFSHKVNQINEQYNITVPFKTVNPDRVRSFLFQDDEFHTILSEGKNFVRLTFSEERLINEIHFQKESIGQNGNVLGLINQLKGFLQYFRKGIFYIASNYQELKKQYSSNKDEFPIESALHTTLDLFNLPDDWRKYLIDSILSNEGNFIKANKQDDIVDLNFYMNGFRYYDFFDSDDHDLKSKIYQYQYENTPEKFLLNVARKANIIAISATADCQTVVGNYDLNFLRKRLGEGYREMENSELIDIEKEYRTNTKGYSQVQINVDFIDVKNHKTELLKIFGQENELADYYLCEIQKGSPKDHVIDRYVRYFKVFKEFVLNKNIKSFLALGMALPDNKKTDFRIDLFEKYAQNIIDLFGNKEDYKSGNPANSIYVVDSSDFDYKKAYIQSTLSHGFKLFVISTYRTVGAGQNLQYMAPEDSKLVKINDFDNKENEKDFDAIYIDKPTHLIVNVNSRKVKETHIVERIFQLESLAQKGQVSNDQLKHEIKKGFTKLSGAEYIAHPFYDKSENNLYSLSDISNNATRILNQAIGRMARCNQKNPYIHIFSSAENIPYLQQSDLSNKLLTREFEELVKKASNGSLEADNTSELKGIGEYNNQRAYNFIHQQIRYIFNEQRNANWNKLRRLVLSYPTFDENDAVHVNLKDYYVELPTDRKHINYTQKQDYKNVKIEFTNTETASISPANCNLPSFMRNKEIKELFVKEGFATDFRIGKYIMTPVLYNNIYKGALGEVIGWHLIRRYCPNANLERLAGDELEQFDAKALNDIYIDFKLWNDAFERNDRDEILNHIGKKMHRTGAKKVLIINIASNKKPVFRQSFHDKIIEIPAIFDLESSNPISEAFYFINKTINA
ncbi:hypothetical protein [Echinicola rosea]|uniref:Helicase/UvrB N-terminal domain-containing protein n=1 Tax=Echinicola rosea TaxID=1807691 RepID=A0ABQ1USU3_9BACT|nr:hypothetical protein [Echinicola rosea]GGF24319.1 hypothetical protein GCM10011339_10520 [Echinicola rosea]